MYKLEIHDFYNIDKKYLRLLNDKILLNYPFIKYLNASANKEITNLNHIYNSLIKSNASYSSGINDNSIKKINLEILYVQNNPKITNLNHMEKTLIELNASQYMHECGIRCIHRYWYD
jgi:hypothetical protein